jgi:hypothetical protein
MNTLTSFILERRFISILISLALVIIHSCIFLNSGCIKKYAIQNIGEASGMLIPLYLIFLFFSAVFIIFTIQLKEGNIYE